MKNICKYNKNKVNDNDNKIMYLLLLDTCTH